MNEPGTLGVLSTNKGLAERFNDLVDIAFVQFKTNLAPSWDHFSEQQNEEGEEELEDMESDQPSESDCNEEYQNCQNYSETLSLQVTATILNNSEITDKIRSLSFKQRQKFDFMYGWAKSLITQKLAKPFNK